MQPYNMNLINDNVPYLYISTMDGTIPIKSILESLYERLSIIYYFDFFLLYFFQIFRFDTPTLDYFKFFLVCHNYFICMRACFLKGIFFFTSNLLIIDNQFIHIDISNF